VLIFVSGKQPNAGRRQPFKVEQSSDYVPVCRQFKSISASRIRLLSRRAVIRGLLQSWPDLTPMEAHVPQFPIAQSVQQTQRRLIFAMGKKGGHAFIELT
jgi:hypothetical protein